MNDEQFNNQPINDFIEILKAMNDALEMIGRRIDLLSSNLGTIGRRIDLLSSNLEESEIIKNNQ